MCYIRKTLREGTKILFCNHFLSLMGTKFNLLIKKMYESFAKTLGLENELCLVSAFKDLTIKEEKQRRKMIRIVW